MSTPKISSKNSNQKFSIPVLVLITIFFSTIIFSSCTTAQSELREDETAAVNDSLYTALQKKDSTKFTTDEYKYYHKLKEKSERELKEAQMDDGKRTVLWVVGIAGVIVGFFVIVGASFKPGC
jgi:hypothetical protein